ncbi:MAG: hypothetical protein ACREC5_01240, partial [Thermoplasmata archaeon]
PLSQGEAGFKTHSLVRNQVRQIEPWRSSENRGFCQSSDTYRRGEFGRSRTTGCLLDETDPLLPMRHGVEAVRRLRDRVR